MDSGSKKDAPPPLPSKPVDPKPPTGTTKCGSGTFTAQEASAACAAGTNGFGCNGVTTSGGRWEAWCKDDSRWLWIRWDDVVSTGALSSACSLGTPFSVKGFFNTSNADGGGVGFGSTGFGVNNGIDPGIEMSRSAIDDSSGNQVAVFESFRASTERITLSAIADCPKLGQVAVSPLRMTLSF